VFVILLIVVLGLAQIEPVSFLGLKNEKPKR